MKRLLLLAVLIVSPFLCRADPPPFSEGHVIVVIHVRTEPGKFDEYVKWLMTTRKDLEDQLVKQGVILDYHVFTHMQHSESDFDIVLTETYANMAALDNLDAKTDAIMEKTVGTRAQANVLGAARGKLRTIVGTDIIREILPPTSG